MVTWIFANRNPKRSEILGKYGENPNVNTFPPETSGKRFANLPSFQRSLAAMLAAA